MISIDATNLKQLEIKYGEELTNKAKNIISKYVSIIERDAKQIINDEEKIDTGRLLNSIKSSLSIYANLNGLAGKVYSGTKYARFIHEGAEHDGNNIKPHFVKFSTAPSLLKWAIRHKKIEKINGDYCFIDNNNQEHVINNIKNSGMMVYNKPIKFFEIPFEKIKDEFVREMSNLVGGV